MDFHQAQLVIEALQLSEEAVDEGEGIVVGLFDHVEGDEADFEVLALKGAALGSGPFDAVLCDVYFDVGAVGNFFEEVK